MKQFLLMLMLMTVGSMSAQVAERVDTVVVDTIDCSNPPIPQIPFGELDSLTMNSLDARYVVVWKGGKCGIYDMEKEENVTRIEYSALRFSFRKEFEGEYYTYFALDEKDRYGLVGVSEKTNEFVVISFPRESKKGEYSNETRRAILGLVIVP